MHIKINFFAFLTASFLIHLLFFSLFRVNFPLPQLQEDFFEVELIPLPDESASEDGKETTMTYTPDRYNENKGKTLSTERQDNLVFANPDTQEQTNPEMIPLPKDIQEKLAFSSRARFSFPKTDRKQFDLRSPGGEIGKNIPISSGKTSSEPEKILRRRGTKSVYKVVEQGKIDQKNTRDYIYNLEMEGEAARRKVIYKPRIPSLNIDRIVKVSFRFSVLPNGEVDQVIPLLKGEPELEKVAMQTLRKYRFSPLPTGGKIQTGIIRFTLKKEIHK